MIAVLLLFLAAACPVFGDLLGDAREYEKKADFRKAAETYAAWLEGNSSSPDFLPVLYRAADLAPSPGEAVKLLDEFLPRAADNRAAAGILSKKASFQEIAGDYSGAQTALERAHALSPGEEGLFFLARSAELLLETGDLLKSEEQARTVAGGSSDPRLKKKAVFQMARVIAAKGDPEEALRVASALTSDPANAAGNEAILLFVFELASGLGRDKEKKAAYDRLAAGFPDSPEFRLAKLASGIQAGVKPFPSPSAVLNPAFPREKGEKTPAPDAGKTSQAPSAVQTGSFSMKENAEYMAADLKKLGFSAELREEVRPDGKRMYKVVVPLAPGERTDAATQNVLIRLKEQGIEGFLIFQ